MGLLNFWISDMMREADENDRRKYAENQAIAQAQGKADYANSLLGAGEGWQTWENGTLSAPSGYPAEFGPVPTTKDWRTAPDLAVQTIGNIQGYRQAPIIAEQQLGIKESLAPREQALKASNDAAAFDALKKYNPIIGNEVLEADAKRPYIVNLTNTRSKEQQIAAENALAKAQRTQVIGLPVQEANAALASSRAEEGQNLVRRVGSDAALGRKDLIEAGVIGGLQNDIMRNTYPGIERNIPEGRQLVVDANSGEMSIVDALGYKDPMAGFGGGLTNQGTVPDQLGALVGKRNPFQFTTRGVIGGQALKDIVAPPTRTVPLPAASPAANVKPVVAPVATVAPNMAAPAFGPTAFGGNSILSVEGLNALAAALVPKYKSSPKIINSLYDYPSQEKEPFYPRITREGGR